MSASNWAVCPRCKARAVKAEAEAMAEVMASYGKVPPEKFVEARSAVRMPELEPTFREDYEIYGAVTGAVTVSYGAGCGVCGLSLSFRDEHPIPGVTS